MSLVGGESRHVDDPLHELVNKTHVYAQTCVLQENLCNRHGKELPEICRALSGWHFGSYWRRLVDVVAVDGIRACAGLRVFICFKKICVSVHAFSLGRWGSCEKYLLSSTRGRC